MFSCLNAGMFRQFSTDMQCCLLLVAMEDVPRKRKANHELLELQWRCRESKTDILKGLHIDKAKEHLLEAACYYKMYATPTCWKGDAKVVDANLAKLKSKAARLDALKENIWMRVKGYWCWEKVHTTWCHKRRECTVKELVTHLKWVEMGQDVPKDPHIKLHERRNDASLGTHMDKIKDTDSKFSAWTEAIR